mgnify:CR=1 FL=1
MTTSDMIRELCEKMNISISELARRIGQTPQNFNKKLQRGTVSVEEMIIIADALGITFVQRFLIEIGSFIQISNKGNLHDQRKAWICK